MKICPHCSQTYGDDTLNFCLRDGSVLDQMSAAETVVLHPAIPTRPARSESYESRLTRSKSTHWLKILIVSGALFSGAVFMVLIVGFLGWISFPKFSEFGKESGSDSPPHNTTPIALSTPPTTAKGEYDVTIAKFERLKVGMTRTDVEYIFSGRGTEYYSGKGGGSTFISVKYVGDNYKTIFVSYRNDQVTSKAQAGLE